MTPELIGTVAVGIAMLGLLWSLHRDMGNLQRDMADVRERMARIEGLFEGFIGRQPEGGSKA